MKVAGACNAGSQVDAANHAPTPTIVITTAATASTGSGAILTGRKQTTPASRPMRTNQVACGALKHSDR
jgi:hypothetical protein